MIPATSKVEEARKLRAKMPEFLVFVFPRDRLKIIGILKTTLRGHLRIRGFCRSQPVCIHKMAKFPPLQDLAAESWFSNRVMEKFSYPRHCVGSGP